MSKNHGTMRWLAGLTLGVALVSVGAGCLVSGTEVFSFPIGTLVVTGGSFDQVTIDLSQDDTFNDHKDEIQLIDRVGFTTDITNNSGQATLLTVYFSTEPGLIDPAKQATPIFVDVPIPAGGRPIEYDESLDMLQNFDQLQEVIKGGVITFYSTATGNVNLTLNDLTMIITFTVGL
jgi:hypothetical protein